MTSATTTRIAALAFAFASIGVACSSGKSGEMEPRYVTVHNAFAALGMSQVGPIHQGSLAEGREARVRVELPPQCTTVVALGSSGVRDIDLVVLDPDDKPIAHDTTKDSQAVVRACAEKGGRFTLVVKMAQGSGDFVAATWTGGPATVGLPQATNAGAAHATGGGTCDSPIVLAAGATSGNTRRGEAEHTGGCASSESKELVYKLDVPRRQRVTIDVDPQFDSVLYMRKDDCADGDAEIACNDDVQSGGGKRSSSNHGSRIDEVLDGGTYYVFVDGYSNEGGTFHMNVALADVPALADVCRQARPLAGQKVTSTLTGAFDHARASCADEAKGPDALHRLDVTQRARVRVTLHSDDFSPVVHLRKTCSDDKTEVGCSDSGAKSEDATWVGLVDPGTYTVFADSSDKAARGRYTIEAELAPEQGSGTKGDSCGDAISIGANEKGIEGDTFGARDDIAGKCSGQGTPDIIYRFDLTKRSRVTAKFGNQEGEHVFVLLRNCTDKTSEAACSANIDEVLGPGTYWLAVDGAHREGLGRYTFSVAARDVTAQEAACKGPPQLAPGQKVTGTTVGAGDKFTTSCGGREDAQSSPDRVFKLVLAEKTKIQLLLSTPNHDGVLAIRKSCLDPPQMRGVRSAEAGCNNDSPDNRHSKIETTLDAGTYFVVVDGHTSKNEGTFTLEYKTLK
jgi:hypothetical protein